MIGRTQTLTDKIVYCSNWKQ